MRLDEDEMRRMKGLGGRRCEAEAKSALQESTRPDRATQRHLLVEAETRAGAKQGIELEARAERERGKGKGKDGKRRSPSPRGCISLCLYIPSTERISNIF